MWLSLALNLLSSSISPSELRGLGLCPSLPHPASFTSFAGRTCYTTSVRHYVNCLANELELVHSFYVRAQGISFEDITSLGSWSFVNQFDEKLSGKIRAGQKTVSRRIPKSEKLCCVEQVHLFPQQDLGLFNHEMDVFSSSLCIQLFQTDALLIAHKCAYGRAHTHILTHTVLLILRDT